MNLNVSSDGTDWAQGFNITIKQYGNESINATLNLRFVDMSGVKFKRGFIINNDHTIDLTVNEIGKPSRFQVLRNVDEDDYDPDQGLSPGVILAFVILGLGVLAFVIEVVLYFVRRK